MLAYINYAKSSYVVFYILQKYSFGFLLLALSVSFFHFLNSTSYNQKTSAFMAQFF